MRGVKLILAGVVAIGLVVPGALAQEDTAQAQRKLLSKRAAEADAYRRLAECIKGLQITSDTYVKDFVAESDTIQAAMDEFLKGTRLGDAKWFADMTCQVPAEVTVAKVVTELKEIHTRHYKGDRIKSSDIEQMNQRIEKKVIKVVGLGAPREELPPGLPAGVDQVITKGPPTPPEPAIPALWKRMPPNAPFTAQRAAELDAKRKLIERIKGLRITSNTLVRDFMAESDQITAVAQGTLIGASIVRVYYHHDEPIAEVTVEVPLESVVETIKAVHTRSIRGDTVKGTDIENVVRMIKTQKFQATGMGIPKPDMLQAYNARTERPEQKIPPWAMGPITMEGHGVPPADKAGTPQGKLLAARAAELDAKRRLAEHIQGLQISSSTLVKDFVAQHDEIRSSVDAILVGSVVDKTFFDGDTATVTVSVPGMQLWEMINGRVPEAAPSTGS